MIQVTRITRFTKITKLSKVSMHCKHSRVVLEVSLNMSSSCIYWGQSGFIFVVENRAHVCLRQRNVGTGPKARAYVPSQVICLTPEIWTKMPSLQDSRNC